MKLLRNILSLGLLLSALSVLSLTTSSLKLADHKKINSYGILGDLDYQGDNISIQPFNPRVKKYHDHIYWQCFSRESVEVDLEDFGYSAEELLWEDNYGLLTIKVKDKRGVFHEFLIRRAWPVEAILEKFKKWRKLMEHEKYVCIAGSAPTLDKEESEKNQKKVVLWYYEQLKTKKGCDSYFLNGCAEVGKQRNTQKLQKKKVELVPEYKDQLELIAKVPA